MHRVIPCFVLSVSYAWNAPHCDHFPPLLTPHLPCEHSLLSLQPQIVPSTRKPSSSSPCLTPSFLSHLELRAHLWHFFSASSPSVATVPGGITLMLSVTLSFCCKQLSICPARLHLSGVNISSVWSRVTPWGSPAHFGGLI